MKWVVISLLVLNGIFLAIQFNKAPEVPPAVDRFPFSGAPLLLVSEQQAHEQARQTTGTQAPSAPPAAESVAAVAQPEPEPAATPPAPAPVEAPRPAPAVVAAKPKSGAMACYRVGPFLLISDVRGGSQLFRRGDIKLEERSESLRKQVGHWVYVPPHASARAAQETLQQLQQNGFDDALIIADGSKANAISVGVYKTEALGKERLAAFQALGYEGRLEPLFRTQAQYWLELELMNSTRIPEDLWREVTAGYPNIQQLRHKCE